MSLSQFIIDNLIVGNTDSFTDICDCGGCFTPTDYVNALIIFTAIFCFLTIIIDFVSITYRNECTKFKNKLYPYVIMFFYELITYSILLLLIFQMHARLGIGIFIIYMLFRIIRCSYLESTIFGISRSVTEYFNQKDEHDIKYETHKNNYMKLKQLTF